MKLIGIIPARGGSKRIPGKNIKEFRGKPMLAYAIEAMLESHLFQRVIVSTDCLKVKKIAEEFGAEVPFLRSDKNSDDYATTADVILEVLGKIEAGKNQVFCCVYPCVPLLRPGVLVSAHNSFIEKNGDFLIPVVEFSYPIQRCLSVNSGLLVFDNVQFINSRSQDLQKKYHDIGQFYFGKVGEFLRQKKMFTGKTVSYEIEPLYMQDIDNQSDWDIAEFKYDYLIKNKLI